MYPKLWTRKGEKKGGKDHCFPVCFFGVLLDFLFCFSVVDGSKSVGLINPYPKQWMMDDDDDDDVLLFSFPFVCHLHYPEENPSHQHLDRSQPPPNTIIPKGV